jgi:zinc finger protein
VALKTSCPACSYEGARLEFFQIKIPYFGDVMESVLLCERCGYRNADVMSLEQREPARYTLVIDSAEDMYIRVIRSSSASIAVPELGVEVTPGSEAEGFVSNVEGVLLRIAEAVRTAQRWAESESARERASELLVQIEEIRAGKRRATLIITDPTGNSAIVSGKARKEVLHEGSTGEQEHSEGG